MYLMPAFHDGHAHPLFAGRESLGPRLDGLESIADIQTTVAAYANANPNSTWIVGGAYDRSLATSFLASWLDEVCLDRPVVLHASDHHTIWVNTRALEIAGLLDQIPEVTTGSIDVDENGRASGTLRESGAMDLVLKRIPSLSIEQELSALDWAQAEMLRHGIASVQDAWIDRGMTEIYLAALSANRLRVRTNLAFRITPENFESDFDYFLQMRTEVQNQNSDLLTAHTVKFFADGVFGSGTAAVLSPYENTESHGEPVWDSKLLVQACQKYAAAGFQLHIHAIGDAGVRNALDAISSAPHRTYPSVIAHTELVDPSDFARFAELDVYANFEPLWARKDGMLTSCIRWLGESRIDSMYRMRSIANAGAKISFGSDWPVSSVSALLGIQTAVTRAVPGEDGWQLDEALSLNEAISAYTSGSLNQISAKFNGREEVVLSASPYEVPFEELHNIEVLQVLRNGKIIWSK